MDFYALPGERYVGEAFPSHVPGLFFLFFLWFCLTDFVVNLDGKFTDLFTNFWF